MYNDVISDKCYFCKLPKKISHCQLLQLKPVRSGASKSSSYNVDSIIPAGSSGTVMFTDLAPGTYTLRVIVRSNRERAVQRARFVIPDDE